LYGPFAYLTTVVLGIPAFLLFRAFAWKSLVAYIFGGGFIGLITASVVFKLWISWTVASSDFVSCVVAGALSALIFWLILHGFEEVRIPSHGEI